MSSAGLAVCSDMEPLGSEARVDHRRRARAEAATTWPRRAPISCCAISRRLSGVATIQPRLQTISRRRRRRSGSSSAGATRYSSRRARPCRVAGIWPTGRLGCSAARRGDRQRRHRHRRPVATMSELVAHHDRRQQPDRCVRHVPGHGETSYATAAPGHLNSVVDRRDDRRTQRHAAFARLGVVAW